MKRLDKFQRAPTSDGNKGSLVQSEKQTVQTAILERRETWAVTAKDMSSLLEMKLVGFAGHVMSVCKHKRK